MSTLRLEHVARRRGRPPHQRIVLHDLSLRVEQGELVAIWGLRRSGRSTLLRVAAGIEAPDSGRVRYDGHDLARRRGLLGNEIFYSPHAPVAEPNASVLDTLTYPQLARGTSPPQARKQAYNALERTAAADCASRHVRELDAGEHTRVMLAQGLTLEPAVIVIDEPLTGVDLLERDALLALLLTLADEGTTILMSTGEATCLAGAHRALTLSCGQLHGRTTPQSATILPFHPRGHQAA